MVLEIIQVQGPSGFPFLDRLCYISHCNSRSRNPRVKHSINARGCQDFSYSLKIRLMHFYINTLPLGVSFPIAIELMLITPILFELCPILCFDLGVYNNFGVFNNTKESNKVNLL